MLSLLCARVAALVAMTARCSDGVGRGAALERIDASVRGLYRLLLRRAKICQSSSTRRAFYAPTRRQRRLYRSVGPLRGSVARAS